MPSPDILWAAAFAAFAGIFGWAVAQVMMAKVNGQRLDDHIKECERRQLFVMSTLTRIENKVDKIRNGDNGGK